MSQQQSIKETLDVIRKALEEDGEPNINKLNDEVLILNHLVRDDGTIDNLDSNHLDKKDVNNILINKLDNIFEIHLEKWLDNNLPQYLEKFFKNKKL